MAWMGARDRLRHATFALSDGERVAADVYRPRIDAARPPLLLVHGTLVGREDYRAFAPWLADALGAEVVIYDRRGRGVGPAQRGDHSLATEADDLASVREAVGATAVLGHSYGGTVTLVAAGREPDAFSCVTYDAALNPNGVLASMWRPEFRAEVEAGRDVEAWALLVAGLGTAGPVSRLPLPTLRSLGSALRRSEVGSRLFKALPGSLREMESILHQVDPLSLPRHGLLLNGGLSPGYFRATSRYVQAASPGMRRFTVPGLMHNGVMLPLPSLARFIARWVIEHPPLPEPDTAAQPPQPDALFPPLTAGTRRAPRPGKRVAR